MQKIVLVSCVATKLNRKAKAKDLYISTLFKYSFAYAELLKPDKVYILSALYHVVEPERVIEPYNVTLCNIPKSKRKPGLIVLNNEEKKKWGEMVIEQLSKTTDLKLDKFIFLAGIEYIKPLQKSLINFENPLSGLGQGKRIAYLKKKVDDKRTS